MLNQPAVTESAEVWHFCYVNEANASSKMLQKAALKQILVLELVIRCFERKTMPFVFAILIRGEQIF